MNRLLITFLSFSALGAGFAGCGGYSKLLKSGDHDLMYRKGLEYYQAKKYNKAITLFHEVSPYVQGTSREDSLSYYSGCALFESGDFETSGMVFDDFRRRFGRSPFLESAEYMYAMGFYHSSPAPNRDQEMTNQAIIAIDEYLSRYPGSDKKEIARNRIDELQRKLYDKSFINARSYYTTERYRSAVTALKGALEKYPETPHREEILFLTVKSSYLLAKHSIPSLQRDRYLDMMDAYYNFASEFPESKHLKEVESMQGDAKKFIARTEPGGTDEADNKKKS